MVKAGDEDFADLDEASFQRAVSPPEQSGASDLGKRVEKGRAEEDHQQRRKAETGGRAQRVRARQRAAADAGDDQRLQRIAPGKAARGIARLGHEADAAAGRRIAERSAPFRRNRRAIAGARQGRFILERRVRDEIDRQPAHAVLDCQAIPVGNPFKGVEAPRQRGDIAGLRRRRVAIAPSGHSREMPDRRHLGRDCGIDPDCPAAHLVRQHV